MSEAEWSVQFAPAAVRALERLPFKIASAVVEFCTRTLPTDPYRMTQPLRRELEGWRVARRGDYRVTIKILEDEGTLLVGWIEHRANIYRGR